VIPLEFLQLSKRRRDVGDYFAVDEGSRANGRVEKIALVSIEGGRDLVSD
jgi:hypothetical protein